MWGGGGGEALQEEINDLSTKFSQLLDTLNAFNKALEEAYHQNTEDDTELENALAQFKKLKVRTNTHLNALSHATEGTQTLENAGRLSKSLEDLEMLLEALQANHQTWFANTPSSPSQETPQNPQAQSAPSDNTPQVKPLWKYGPNTLQAFQDYMKAKDLGSAGAWLELGKMAVEGIVLYPDNHVAMRCFEKAIELGSVGAMVELGKLYMENGDTQVLEYGSGEVLEGVAVEKGLINCDDEIDADVDSYAGFLEHCHVFADKKMQNCQQKAKELFEKAGELGEGRAYRHLGELYRQYNDFGETSEGSKAKSYEYYKKAVELLKRQAKQGDIEAHAEIGQAFVNRLWLAEKGDPDYQDENLVEKAIEAFQKAIDLDCHQACSYLGRFYESIKHYDGHESGQDEQKSIQAYKKGIQLGSGLCARQLVWDHATHGINPFMLSMMEGKSKLEIMQLYFDAFDQAIKWLKMAVSYRHYKALPLLLEYLATQPYLAEEYGFKEEEEKRLNQYERDYSTYLRFASQLGPKHWHFWNDRGVFDPKQFLGHGVSGWRLITGTLS
ncbi:tetratricopeptide repeat protein [Helicobacter mehlei]|uniref:tetratricopeptide repeat protein n=1 Tax=Helicobacter mehlei TaxID=2316080 RepID=UPI000EAEE319|nr:tetratricopeptide repeat protein [Helicobacter mehlei]